MKKTTVLLSSLLFFSATLFAQKKPMKEFVDDLMAKMTVEEKIGQLNLMPGTDLTTGAKTSSPLVGLIEKGQLGAVLNITCYKNSAGRICSGRVYACRNTGWTYGWIEARIMLPKGKGTWPAFWMMPVNFSKWPEDGENDIMEEVGYNPNYVSSTIHCNAYNNSGTAKEHKEQYVANAEGGWHVYACEWTADYIAYYIDGNKYFTYTPDNKTKTYWPFNTPFYIILNLAWGGSWGGQKGVDETVLPATMKVDYVRVFQK